MTILPYPLAWPEGMPRTAPGKRVASKFKTTLPAAGENVRKSLEAFGRDSGRAVSEIVATSNVGGIGLSKTPDDPGVAVWFMWDGALRCVAVDRYPKTADNLQAIHHVLEARRTEVRHGGLVIARTAFAGFKSLPAPEAPKHWSEVLGVSPAAGADSIRLAYREAAKKAHPDAGGNAGAMQRVNRAFEEAKKERGFQ